MNLTLTYCKDLLQLALSPRKAWIEIAHRQTPPEMLMRQGFYPLLAFVAVTAVVSRLYQPQTFDLASALQLALVQFLSLLLSYFFARIAIENLLPRLTADHCGNLFNGLTVTVYCLSLLAVIQIVGNLCPVQLTVLYLVPLLVTLVAWQAREYLDISPYRNGHYLILALLIYVAIPAASYRLLMIIID